jgi:hypothetical protein
LLRRIDNWREREREREVEVSIDQEMLDVIAEGVQVCYTLVTKFNRFLK